MKAFSTENSFIYSYVILWFLTFSDYGFSNASFKPSNVMSYHELIEQNEAGDDEVDDYEEENEAPEYVAKEFRSLKTNINKI